MDLWGIPILGVAVAAVVYGIVTHRRWLWAISGAYIAVSVLAFLLLGLGHGGAGFVVQGVTH